MSYKKPEGWHSHGGYARKVHNHTEYAPLAHVHDFPVGARIFHQANEPDPAVEGDIPEGSVWYDSDNGNLQHRYESGVWVEVKLGGEALGVGEIGQRSLAANQLGGALSNAIADPRFSDPERQAVRAASSPGWTFDQAVNLIPATGWVEAAPEITLTVTQSTDPDHPGTILTFDLNAADLAPGDLLATSPEFPADPDWAYTLLRGGIPGDFGLDCYPDIRIEWLDSTGMVLSTTNSNGTYIAVEEGIVFSGTVSGRIVAFNASNTVPGTYTGTISATDNYVHQGGAALSLGSWWAEALSGGDVLHLGRFGTSVAQTFYVSALLSGDCSGKIIWTLSDDTTVSDLALSSAGQLGAFEHFSAQATAPSGAVGLEFVCESTGGSASVAEATLMPSGYDEGFVGDRRAFLSPEGYQIDATETVHTRLLPEVEPSYHTRVNGAEHWMWNEMQGLTAGSDPFDGNVEDVVITPTGMSTTSPIRLHSFVSGYFPESVTYETWHTVGAAGEPAFENGWTGPVEFQMDAVGGLLLAGSASGGTAGTAVFTLASGYRSDRRRLIPGGDAFWRVETDGSVYVDDTGDLVPTGGFTGALRLVKQGALVTMTGYVDRDDDFGGGAVDLGIVVPSNMIPAGAGRLVGPPATGYNSTQQYRYIVETDGRLQVQRTGVITTFMAVSMSWTV